jgi:SAF domain
VTTPSRLHRFLRDLARAASWHRRKLAVVAAVAAVITGVSAAHPPDPPSVDVVRATRQLPAGTRLTEADVRSDRIPVAAAPDSALSDPREVVGASAMAPLARGQTLTMLAVGRPRATRPGMVVAPLSLADARLAAVLRVGDRVDVLAPDPARTWESDTGGSDTGRPGTGGSGTGGSDTRGSGTRGPDIGDSSTGAGVVARDVLVVGLPKADPDALIGDGSGPLVLVEVDLATATALDRAASGLGIVLR